MRPAAEVLGDKYKFYRLHGTTKKPKYDSGLQYGRGIKYGDRNGQDTGSFDDGRVFDAIKINQTQGQMTLKCNPTTSNYLVQ